MANLTESSSPLQNKPVLLAGIAGGVVLLLILIYFGLSALSSSKAEERLQGMLIEAGQPYALQWDKLSSSPLGGTITLKGVRFNLEQESMWSGTQYYRTNATSVTLKGFNTDQSFPRNAEIRLEAVEFPPIPEGRGERNALRQQVMGSIPMEMMLASGRSELPPVTLHAAWKAKKSVLELDWNIELPDMLSASGEQRFEGQLAGLLGSAEQMQANLLGAFGSLMGHISQVGITRFNLQVRDLGMLERSSQLQQRYAVARREADKDSEAQKQMINEHQVMCAQSWGEAFANGNACQRLAEFLAGQRKTLKLDAAARDAVSLSDFERGGMALLKLRLQPKLN